ncbi:DNA-binding protein [Haladaptatus sp. R4]|uniref:response regulator transcription factor n=1 Tax=Haladaptatus sp. R4 TaxID=1679489 RepID=UPI0007B49BF0|nr:response regulator [Haladaptatus sp. R4]KZN26124.1 DNA-binding protein [Haladaptatus sp. R4]
MSDEPTVLIVDDEHAITDLHARWLDDSYDVRKAYNGTEALDKIDDSVDIVLLDRRMPDYSGQEVLGKIRELSVDCRVAMVTAVEPDFDILELGFDDYICKPVSDPEQLREIVSSLETRSAYDSQVQQFLSLSSKRAALEDRKEANELSQNEDYVALETQLASLRNELSSTAMDLDDDDLRAEFHNRNGSGSKLMESAKQNDASETKN